MIGDMGDPLNALTRPPDTPAFRPGTPVSRAQKHLPHSLAHILGLMKTRYNLLLHSSCLSGKTDGNEKGRAKRMKILLLSRNRVVKELVKLAVRELEASMETAEELPSVRGDRYDVLLADETAIDISRLRELDDLLLVQRRVLLGNRPADAGKYFEVCISKPFLPDDIVRAIRGERGDGSGKKGEKRSGFSGKTAAGRPEEKQTRILDPEEIETIQRLLDEEIFPEDSGAREEGLGEESSTVSMDAGRLIELLEKMKTSKLRKLLKGAEITLKIRFPEKRG